MTNPLPPCPDLPNCVRRSERFAAAPATLCEAARAALDDVGAARVEADAGRRRLDALFAVLLFKDDVAVAVEPAGDGAVLHIRSASRVGRHDLGVNARRVRKFMDALHARLDAVTG